MPVSYVLDEVFLDHRPPGAHPERPERLTAIRRAFDDEGLIQAGTRLPVREASGEELLRVHDERYLEKLTTKVAGQKGWLDADTYYSAGSYRVARAAAAAAIDVSLAVWNGDAEVGLAVVRPPGHHAEADRAMGFCLLNNVAIAARALQAAGARRVAILDWDVHHGNGTEHIFAGDAEVLYLSVHQYPYYPGTGAPDDCGVGAGRGTTVNVGLQAGAGDVDYALVMDEILAPAMAWFAPDIILVSAGFDAHAADPLAAMEVTARGYGYLAARVAEVASDVCGSRVACVLEGGYDLSGLGEGMTQTLRVLGGEAEKPALNGEPAPATREAIAATRRAHQQSPWAQEAA